MDFVKLAQDRYSCKKYADKAVEPEKLALILEAGRQAPTAKNLQPEHIYVLQSEEALAKMDKLAPCRYGAKTVLLVTFNKNNVFTYPGGKHNSGVEDATIVATHLMLGAKAVGVESCWLNFFDPEAVAKEFNLPADEEVLMFLDLGYAAEGAGPLDNHGKRKALTEIVTYL